MSCVRKRSYRPTLEGLEERIVPYALSGFQWANDNISASFMPDAALPMALPAAAICSRA